MNRHDSGRFCTESLESAAKRYKTLGFSIIPLNGARNPQHPKLPVIKWGRFQHTHPSDEELQSWFGNQPQAGIGIVCGRISRLMVLDFDDAAVASEFRHLHPDLVNTFTVRSGTRKLPHFYYRLPQGMLIQTVAYPGVDLRGEGSYVVASPTTVGDAVWLPENDLPIREVSDLDIRRIMRFLATRKIEALEPVHEAVEAVSISEASEFRHLVSSDDLVDHYRRRCGTGRNQALFQTALIARDMGVMEAAFGLHLAPVHASEPGHNQESYNVRYAEALRTIGSAYSRPPRQKQKSAIECLGTSVREWFLGNGLANVARVLDGLYSVGFKPDDQFTELDACQNLAALKIGRRSIMVALKAIIADWRLFETVVSPPNPPVSANAAKGSDDLNNSCEMSRGAKRVKNGRGRPARLYRLPSPDVVAAKIGLKSKGSHMLANDDYCSSKAYRQALHSELLTRRPGYYGRLWLSARLGVSRWTARRYEKAADIQVQPTYMMQTLSWGTAASLPKTVVEAPRGVFMETHDGNRYPAIRGLALKLLKTGHMPVLKHQQGNFYRAGVASVGIPTPQVAFNREQNAFHQKTTFTSVDDRKQLIVGIPTPHDLLGQEQASLPKQAASTSMAGRTELGVGIPTPQWLSHIELPHSEAYADKALLINQPPLQAGLSVGIPTLPKVEPSFWLCPECLNFHITAEQPTTCTRCGNSSVWEFVSPAIWRDAQALKHWWQQRYREHQQDKHQRTLAPTAPAEEPITETAKSLVDRLHKQIPDLSFANARKLVHQFSEQLIEKALTVINGREKIRSPAGFLVSFLRSESKLLFNNKSPALATQNAKKESSIEWLRRLATSEYLSFIANVDDILNLHLEAPNKASEA